MRKLHILLVDDDPFILTGIGKDLSGEGYAVTTADSGERAIELMKKTHFDLVITDLVMDRIDGIQVLKAGIAPTSTYCPHCAEAAKKKMGLD